MRIKSINIITFVSYGLCFLLAHFSGIDWVKVIPGAILLFYLPGYNLNSILFKKSNLQWFTRLSLDVSSSIAILSLIYLALSSIIQLDPVRLIILIIVSNLALAVIKYFFAKGQYYKFDKSDKWIFIVFLIPILLFVLRLILNPYIFDIDSLVYFDAYKDIVKYGIDTGYLFNGRELFPFYFAAAKHVAGMDYILFFKFITPVFFYLTSAIIFIFLKDKKRPYLKWLYLLILTSPMIAIMNEGVRPETFNIILTLPALITAYLSIKNNDVRFLALSAAYALTAFKFHELAMILVGSVAVSVVVLIAINLKTVYRAARNNLSIAIAITIPYLLLVAAYYKKIMGLFDNVLIEKFYILTRDGISNIKWDWWFIDSAVTRGGAKISWPGYTAIWYYLYSGIIALLFLVLILVLISVYKKNPKRPKMVALSLIPIIVFWAGHLITAEVLPRLGIIFMFNRSWPYIAISSVVISIILVSKLLRGDMSVRFKNVVITILALSVIAGVAGTMAGSVYMGGMVLPQEKSAIDEIRRLPQDALIVSTQRNQNLVKIYTGKQFVQIIGKHQYSDENFYEQVKEDIQKAIDNRKEKLSLMERVDEINSVRLIFNHNSSKIDSDKRRIKDNKAKLPILKEYNPIAYAQLTAKLDNLEQAKSGDIYFLYSFAKLNHGILTTRDWWRISADQDNYDFFKEYEGPFVEKTNNYIIIKINDLK